jgi:hypothetical protein
MPKITLDTVTWDPANEEFVLYLVEDGPWPETGREWVKCLDRIQDRIMDAIDLAVNGHLLKKFPDSAGKRVRIQIDSPHGVPAQVAALTARLRAYVERNDEYRDAVARSAHIEGLRLVTGHEMGRFK